MGDAPIPIPDPTLERVDKAGVEGELPSPLAPPSGCRFRTRCWKAQEICARAEPALSPKPGGQLAACHFPEPPQSGG